MGIIETTDLGVLAAYCNAWHNFRWSIDRLKRDGRVVRCGEGNQSMKPHPATSLQKNAVNEMRQLAGELGLSPTARERLTGPDDDFDPEDEDYFG